MADLERCSAHFFNTRYVFFPSIPRPAFQGDWGPEPEDWHEKRMWARLRADAEGKNNIGGDRNHNVNVVRDDHVKDNTRVVGEDKGGGDTTTTGSDKDFPPKDSNTRTTSTTTQLRAACAGKSSSSPRIIRELTLPTWSERTAKQKMLLPNSL
ncbi:unnamed protein product [Amoebophrya sp. A25]|nr:unnamed protein product [Amoebophrya sp. A25]|eukprot:GSA25T00001334001.1